MVLLALKLVIILPQGDTIYLLSFSWLWKVSIRLLMEAVEMVGFLVVNIFKCMASNAVVGSEGDIPFNYLGLPIGSNMKSIASWLTLLVDVFFHMSFTSCRKIIFCRVGALTLIKFRAWRVKPLAVLKHSTLLFFNNGVEVAFFPKSPFGSGLSKLYHGQEGVLGLMVTFITVKDARYRIDQNILPTLAHATTWDKSIPRKVNVFMWRLFLDRLPHRLNLSSRGSSASLSYEDVIQVTRIVICNFHHVCDIATDMWKLVFRWCDIPLFQASSWDSFNDWIISWHASKEKKHRFYVITTSVLWWLWRYRNSVTFSSQPLRKSDLFDNVRFSLFSWLHNRDHMKLSWNDWLMYPLSITRNGNG
ncbi:hypothetical protein Tco_1133070 [Tanacetum coccineum]|uniref:Reverse transcriptase zinc-binding domain-containing protein n=1 Tax=Tanacetum coccineum TaxID=301880 RepID=A0ABQ5JDP3_9ASTR